MCRYPCDTQVIQTAKDTISNCDALADLLEAIEHFVNRLSIYTQILPTPAMDEIVVKILMELLSSLALVTEKLKRQRSSECFLADVSLYSASRSQISKEFLRGEGDRGGPAEARPTHGRRSSDYCSSDTPSCPRPRPEYERSHRR